MLIKKPTLSALVRIGKDVRDKDKNLNGAGRSERITLIQAATTYGYQSK